MIKRDFYLDKIKDKMWNGAVKIITGIRRCGKSFLLNEIFRKYLLESGVAPSHIISVSLDLEEFEVLQNPRELSRYVREHVLDDERHYVFIDEIQEARKVLKDGVDLTRIAKEDEPGIWFTFYDVLNHWLEFKDAVEGCRDNFSWQKDGDRNASSVVFRIS